MIRQLGGSYGLGLAMAQDIALNHHGKLTLESEYGKWIEFTYEMRSLCFTSVTKLRFRITKTCL